MSKAEDYIVNNMENGLITGWDDKNRPICQSWLTPDQARRAVKIAREEMLNEICEWISKQEELLEDSFSDPNDFVNILKQAMKDE